MVPKRGFHHGLAIAGFLLLSLAGVAQGAPDNSPVGSGNVTVADPTVPRPPGQPCVVQLFSNDTFNDYSPRPFNYTPPSGCGTHWSKVVLEGDFSITSGVQYDRTATIFLAGVNLYFGTTQEPTETAGRSWHVERDLTDYTALFRNAGAGQVFIGNIVNSTYTGVIHGSARLLFYPASVVAPAANAPDAVYPLGSDPVGSTVTLNDSSSQMAATLTLPRNVERAYLDVFTQSQSNDEFWYTCVPDPYASETEECGGGNFREAEISIDGQPAGVAPVYPWIYTGGIDLFIWKPTPGVQTLNFMPYRVDLTPFAGILSNGSPHTVAVSVEGANSYFSATASLLVYEDKGAHQVSGALVQNTLANQPPTPTIGSTLTQDSSGNVTGAITTDLSRHFAIEGYVNTSHGRVDTTVNQTVSFADTQTFDITSADYQQISNQLTKVDGYSRSMIGKQLSGEFKASFRYPLNVAVNETIETNGGYSILTAIKQGYDQHTGLSVGGFPLYSADVHNHVQGSDTLVLDSNFDILSHSGQQTTQTFTFGDSLGGCYSGSVSSANNVVTAYSTGQACPGHRNRVYWFTHPDGSPYQGDTLLPW
ncbi:peptide-N(4)-(N-acetyl-beta-glucosaminyl)asparagine amidase [Dyella monticola]|uniref:Peptide-N(4)-(N-acetyl-beta-glucosaminyl)asparagine amidase n=1 Tax=Dyella monticola TaxID=1927958 RepID=A0A370WZV3_9GAMM|nr:peptide-N4-asparagine amidase [Dyella monticola]RDS81626.1 peptide-N(4)-(N-acetyl-beta-glucosaminyl)asparagine amidase [Dyella monticola]